MVVVTLLHPYSPRSSSQTHSHCLRHSRAWTAKTTCPQGSGDKINFVERLGTPEMQNAGGEMRVGGAEDGLNLWLGLLTVTIFPSMSPSPSLGCPRRETPEGGE